MYEPKRWPAWCVGPNGEGRVYDSPEQMPEGWRSAREASQEKSGSDGAVTLGSLGITREDAKAALDEAGIKYAKNIPDNKLARLVQEFLVDDDSA